MSWPTCRRHPRSLAEAWPQHYADPIERYRAPWRWRDLIRAVICVACCIAIPYMISRGV